MSDALLYDLTRHIRALDMKLNDYPKKYELDNLMMQITMTLERASRDMLDLKRTVDALKDEVMILQGESE